MSRDIDHEREAIEWAKRAEDAYRNSTTERAEAAARISQAHSAIAAYEQSQA